MGIERSVCGEKLIVLQEGEWKKFRDQIISVSHKKRPDPCRIFSILLLGNIIKRVVNWLN